MARYRTYYIGKVEAWYEVDADSPEEAQEIVESGDYPAPDVCAQCSGHGQPHGLIVDGTWDPWQFSDVREVDHAEPEKSGDHG